MYKRKDAYHARAKREGYRSRAAYKLLELNREFRLLRRGEAVVDLGCWPGGWLQVASRLVGPRGRVVGVDPVPVSPLAERNVAVVRGEAGDPSVQGRVLEVLGRKADVVLSDMAPKLSGIKEADDARAAELSRTALRCAHGLLRPGGRLVVKAFTGPQLNTLVEEARRLFATVATTRPDATRKGSAEVYIVGRNYRPGAAAFDSSEAVR